MHILIYSLKESCLTVAILLHYFFMAAFCWMLSEGVLLFIMLYFVFYNGFFKRKRFFFAIGWGKKTICTYNIYIIKYVFACTYYIVNFTIHNFDKYISMFLECISL